MSRSRRLSIRQRYARYGYDVAPETVSIYRPVEVTDELEKVISPIQDEIDDILEQNGLSVIEKIAVESLRVILLPTNTMADLPQRNAQRLQKDVYRKLQNASEPIENINARGCIVLRGYNNSFVSLNFTDDRLVAEQDRVFAAIGKEREAFRLPLMCVCIVPTIPRTVTQEITRELLPIARQVYLSAGPVQYDIR